MIYKHLKFLFCTIFHKKYHFVEQRMGKIIVGQVRLTEEWMCSKCKTYWIVTERK